MNFQLVEFLKCDSAVLAGIIEDGTSRFAFWFHINFKAKAISDDDSKLFFSCLCSVSDKCPTKIVFLSMDMPRWNCILQVTLYILKHMMYKQDKEIYDPCNNHKGYTH